MAETEQLNLLRCQRIGCDATFSSDNNPDDSCRYHDSGPIFHDGTKEWSCCKKKSHDFSLFLQIPGCKTGKHTREKPVLPKPSPSPRNPTPAPNLASGPPLGVSSRETCTRCRQGFFCADHGSQAQPRQIDTRVAEATVKTAAPPKRIVGINEPQICKNKGCGQTFKEKDNHEIVCSYHPGPAIFHDRMRGWKCCDVHVKEFDEFMSIPACTKGWHNADPTSS